jgi:hypothetical protein
MDYLLKPEDSQWLDRLVDGELTDAERRELLLKLERTPDGWRRCALAFLEHQAWRSESKSWASGAPEIVLRPTPAGIAGRSWSTPVPWTMAVAACLLIATGFWAVVRDKDGHAITRIEVPDGGSMSVTQSPTFSTAPNMRLVVDGGPNESDEVVEVPLVNAGQLDQALFGPWSQSVSPEVMQMLEKAGHQVVRERRLMPFDLRDGRRVVVPMDQVEIRPVGNGNRFQ